MIKIDVNVLAQNVSEEINPIFANNIQAMIQSVHSAEGDIDKIIELVSGFGVAIIKHSETFTVKLIQSVVDSLDKD